jgi:hypothetical protein
MLQELLQQSLSAICSLGKPQTMLKTLLLVKKIRLKRRKEIPVNLSLNSLILVKKLVSLLFIFYICI